MSDEYLSFEEELALAAPLSLEEDEVAICDIRSCLERASSIVPGSMLCAEHERAYGIGAGRTYSIPLGELFDPDFVEIRRAEYAEKLAEKRTRLLVAATAERRELIAELRGHDLQ